MRGHYHFRHYKLEAELAEVNWRVRWDDIMFGVQEKRRMERSSSRASLTRVRTATTPSYNTTTRSVSTTTDGAQLESGQSDAGTYRNNTVLQYNYTISIHYNGWSAARVGPV